MRCPFLREAQVKFCQASPFKKLIVRLPEQTGGERCSSPDYRECPAAKQHHEERPSLAHCPFLHESLVQYCTAASVAKYIPYSESSISRCGTDSHRYCQLYSSIAQNGGDAEAQRPGGRPDPPDVLRLPPHLYVTANHLWLDAGEDGTLHIGLDGFLASVLGGADQISYLSDKGAGRPGIVLTVRGVDLTFLFPREIMIKGVNTTLRTHPERLFVDPFTQGWLFEGTEMRGPNGGGPPRVFEGLLHGEDAAAWMRSETRRLAQLLHEFASKHASGSPFPLAADGGGADTGAVRHLSRPEILRLYNDFFSPHAELRGVRE